MTQSLRGRRDSARYGGLVAACALVLSNVCIHPARSAEQTADKATPRDLSQAHDLFQRYRCTECHGIPGVASLEGKAGGDLSKLRARRRIGGAPNTIDNVVRWIVSPASIDPKAEMPSTGISESDARILAEYLYQY